MGIINDGFIISGLILLVWVFIIVFQVLAVCVWLWIADFYWKGTLDPIGDLMSSLIGFKYPIGCDSMYSNKKEWLNYGAYSSQMKENGGRVCSRLEMWGYFVSITTLAPLVISTLIAIYPVTITVSIIAIIAHIARFAVRLNRKIEKHVSDKN